MNDKTDKIYDIIIIGGGPAGLSAGIYAGRANLSTLMIERGTYGGQIFQSSELANYPGGIMGETGAEFSMRISKHADELGMEKTFDDINEVDFSGEIKVIKGMQGEYKAKYVIIATGTHSAKLGIPGEDEFTGRGVSYCATCDAPFFKDLDVYVAGGGDSALEEALHLSKFAKNVYVIHRRDKLRAAKALQEKAKDTDNIEFLLNTKINEIKGKDLIEAIVLEDTETGEIKEIQADKKDGTFGVFVFVGLIPNTEIFTDLVKMDKGYIITNEEMETNIKGVYAAGDVRKKSLRQVVTATSDGAIAAVNIDKALTLDE